MSKQIKTLYSSSGILNVDLPSNGSIAIIHVASDTITHINNSGIGGKSDINLGVADLYIQKDKSGSVTRIDIKATEAEGEFKIPVTFESRHHYTNEKTVKEAVIALTIGKPKVYAQPERNRYGYGYDRRYSRW